MNKRANKDKNLLRKIRSNAVNNKQKATKSTKNVKFENIRKEKNI